MSPIGSGPSTSASKRTTPSRSRRPRELEEYTGRYVLGGVGDVIRLRAEGKALIFEETYGDRSAISDATPDPPPPARAKPYDRDRMILVDGPYKGAWSGFLRDPDGRIAWLRMGRVYARQGDGS